jgi:hypothetical protein
VQKITLLHWGLFCFLAAIVMGILPTTGGKTRAERRGAMLGKGAAQILAAGVGVALIATHFIRRRK